MTWLQTSWMDNPTFLAEMAHFAWAYGVIITAALFSANRRQLIQLVFAFTAFALVKEFWYDLAYELPNDSLAGSLLDFAVYCFGLAVALAGIGYRQRLDRRRQPPRMSGQSGAITVGEKTYPFGEWAVSCPRIYDPER